jgi:signal transduction histidine kinase
MSLRSRLLVAFLIVVLVPVALLALGLRKSMRDSLSDLYRTRLDAVAAGIGEYLRFESEGIDRRLESLARAIVSDARFRAAVAGNPIERQYLLEYASGAMELAGLGMLQIQDDQGRIISSGHFRNEHGRVDPPYFRAIAAAKDQIALVEARSPDGAFLALARAREFDIGGRAFSIVGGVVVDRAFLTRLVRDTEVISLIQPEGRITSRASEAATPAPAPDDVYVSGRSVPLLRVRAGSSLEPEEAQFQVSQSLSPVEDLLRSTDSWFVTTAAVTALAALLISVWVSSRISRPISELADKTAVLDLDRLDVQFDEGTDEVGRLSRVLRDLSERLRVSTVRIREAERRATIGDLSRQINHDIKNGLIPMRNVLRHLTQVARDEPAALPAVLAERQQTIESSVSYLETLATNYERLTPRGDRRDCDVNDLVSDVLRGARGHEHVHFQMDLASDLPRLSGDPIALRRILENLVTNAVDALPAASGRVVVSTALSKRDDEQPAIRIAVADTGRGMTPEEQALMLKDFYTTKKGGSGLGLSIVRRLVMDLHGTLRVESEVGKGTRMTVELPAARSSPQR